MRWTPRTVLVRRESRLPMTMGDALGQRQSTKVVTVLAFGK